MGTNLLDSLLHSVANHSNACMLYWLWVAVLPVFIDGHEASLVLYRPTL
jgi:hypothetical protein